MAFVNRYITPENRDKFNLDVSDRWVFNPSPSLGWAIDEEAQTFIRVLRPYARRNEFGDPNSMAEYDFHFHWKGRDFIVCTRAGITPDEYEGRQMGEMPSEPLGKHVYTFLIREIAETTSQDWNWRFAQDGADDVFFKALREALAQGNGGVFKSLYGEVYQGPRQAVLKIAPGRKRG